MLAVAHNAIVSVASKVEDNILQVIITLFIALKPIAPSNPMANLPCALQKRPNALVIKQLCIPSSELKAAKPRPKLAKARAQQQY